MYACNNCGADINEADILANNEGEILCKECFEEEMSE